jgi:hypothetical protein
LEIKRIINNNIRINGFLINWNSKNFKKKKKKIKNKNKKFPPLELDEKLLKTYHKTKD